MGISLETLALAKKYAADAVPEKGVDYWTEEDKEEIVQDVLDALPDGDSTEY